MAVLHILKTTPDDVTRMLMESLVASSDQESTTIEIGEATDYEELIDLIFAHDKVVCWW